MKNRKKYLNNIFSKVSLRYIPAVILLIASFTLAFIYINNKVQSFLLSQMYQKAELAASSGTSSIKIFLEMAENSLLLLSKNSSIVNLDTQTQKTLDNFAQDWTETPIMSVARFDKDGVLRFLGSNIGTTIDTASNPISGNKKLYDWATTATEGDVYLAEPLIPKIKSSKPQYVFPFITPMFRNGEFDGVLALAISLPRLTVIYLDPLNVTPNSRVYLLHSDGTILASPSENVELIGVNYFEYLRNKPYPGSKEALQKLTMAVEDKHKGKLDLVLYSPIEKKLVRFIMAHSPLVHHNKRWTLGIAIPVSGIADTYPDFLKESKIMVISLFIYLVMTFSFVGILIAKTNKKNTILNNSKEDRKTKK